MASDLKSTSNLRLLRMPRPNRDTRPKELRYMTVEELEDLAAIGAVAFTPDHTVHDIIRYAVERANGDVALVMLAASSMRNEQQ